MPNKCKILFLCTGNACRSQMAEAILRHIAGDRFEVMSAGSRPAGFVHPLAIDALRYLKVPVGDPMSKHLDRFAEETVDAVITLCDNAAKDPCPVWPGSPHRAHWPLPDPAHHIGTDDECLEFAVRVAMRLRAKLEGLTAVDWTADPEEVDRQLDRLADI